MSPLQKLALASYKYTTIKAAASEIRLLTLHPAPRHSDQPIISIQTTTLTDDHVPTYEGLSYAWGKWSTLEDILVLEKEVSRSRWFGSKKPIHSRLAVTPNLAEALRYLRLEDKERVFWIDAVCIDQKNLKERSEQVVRMGEVYTKAVRVVAWLGPEEGPIKGENESLGTKAGIKLLKDLGDKLFVNWATGDIHPAPSNEDEKEWADIQVELDWDFQTCMTVKSVIDKPWFGRLWIWQEIRLGSPTSVLVCGNDTILWNDFRKAVFLLNFKRRHPTLGSSLVWFYSRLRFIYPLISVITEGTNSLERLLEDTQRCEYLDPRDRIFSILSLLNYQGRKIGLVADYTQPVHKVYQDVVLKFMESRRTMNILNHCELQHENELTNTELPTWVPDWEHQKNLPREAYGWQHASGTATCSTKLLDNKILAASGVRVAVIESIDRTDLNSTGLAELVNIVRTMAPENVMEGEYAAGGSLLDAFCRTIFWDVISDRFVPPLNVVDDFQMFKSEMGIILTKPYAEDPPTRWLKNVYTYNLRCCYFTTKEGYMGFAPRSAKTGDILVTFRGLDVIMALREHNNAYRVVGGCYLHGFMTGEGLLGPIPEPYQSAFRFDSMSSQYWRCFYNKETCEYQSEDPRLGSLPPGWIMKEHTLSHVWTWFWNEETGEDGETNDPRLETERLLERGTPLETFDLV